jgi:hypothetical protein
MSTVPQLFVAGGSGAAEQSPPPGHEEDATIIFTPCRLRGQETGRRKQSRKVPAALGKIAGRRKRVRGILGLWTVMPLSLLQFFFFF